MLLREARPSRCSIPWSKLIGLVGITLSAGMGCVGSLPVGTAPLFPSECESPAAGKPATASLVVLDWTGGTTPIYPGRLFLGVDLSMFSVEGGGVLADDADVFKELVRREVSRIYCDWAEVSVAVRNGEDDGEGIEADTVVYITHEVKPDGGMDIGQGEYDPCDNQSDNSAIIYGKRIAQLGDAYAFDEWVNVFANVIAHEVGHTLGYGHVAREQRTDVGRSVFVELMLDRHTMTEMRRAQRFVADQTNCGDAPAPAVLGSTQGAGVAPECTCGHR